MINSSTRMEGLSTMSTLKNDEVFYAFEDFKVILIKNEFDDELDLIYHGDDESDSNNGTMGRLSYPKMTSFLP